MTGTAEPHSEAAQRDSAFTDVLAAERLRNSRHIALLRLIGTLGILGLSLGFGALFPGFVGGATWIMGLYTLGATLILWGRQYSARIAQLDGYVISLVDMPLVALLLHDAARRLGDNPDAPSTIAAAPAYFTLLTFLAALSLDRRQILCAAAVGVVLQTLLFYWVRPNPFAMAQGVLILGLATALSLYARERIVRLVDSFARAQLQRERLGRYFSPQVAEHLAQHGGELGEGESREVTVLFADLRDFTALTEHLDGPAVVATLNEFHGGMVEQLFAFQGTLDKYMGDGIMAYFGAPVMQPQHADQAVLCALAMQDSLAQINLTRVARGDPPLRMGIGVHTGRVVLGDIGAPRRREYTAIGDTVNVAARIEQLTKIHGSPVLVSEVTRGEVHAGIDFVAVEPLPVKGKSAPIQTFVAQRRTSVPAPAGETGHRSPTPNDL